uniref:Uncharacterized protein n=1 Tax=Sinocyclocheilus anshuiensis TaxID=1608454 RepID=A0A671PP58_9TELE
GRAREPIRGETVSASVTCRQCVRRARVPLAFVELQNQFSKGWVSCSPNPCSRASRSSRSSCSSTHGCRAVRKRKAALLAPVVPLSFVLAYQVDAAYGSLMHRMREEAESIMVSESERLALPQGMPTFESIEKSRRAKAHLTSLLER